MAIHLPSWPASGGPPTVTLAELAALTGRPEAWWRRHWLDHHRRHGFPRRLPGLWAWPRGAVEAWLAAGGASPPMGAPAAAIAANANDPVEDPVAFHRALLDARLQQAGRA